MKSIYYLREGDFQPLTDEEHEFKGFYLPCKNKKFWDKSGHYATDYQYQRVSQHFSEKLSVGIRLTPDGGQLCTGYKRNPELYGVEK